MIDFTDVLGYVAGALTSLCTVPQIIRIWRVRSADDVSYRMFFTLTLGVTLWIWFGIIKGEMAIIVTNAISFVLNVIVLFSKWHFGRKK